MKRKAFFNTFWNCTDYFTNVFLSLFITIIFVRELSLNEYGLVSYSKSLIAIALSLGAFGLKNTLIRLIPQEENTTGKILSESFTLLIITSTISYILLVLFSFISEDNNNFYYLLILSTSVLLNPLNVIEYNFRAYLETKYIFISKLISGILSGILKIFIATQGFYIEYIAAAFIFENVLWSILIIYFHVSTKKQAFSLTKIINSTILKTSSNFFIITILIISNEKIGILLVRFLSDLNEVALYDVSIKIYEVWSRLEILIFLSIIPFLIKLRKNSYRIYEKYFNALWLFLFIGSISLAIIFTIFGKEILVLIFGSKYNDSYKTAILFGWSTIIFTLWIGQHTFYILNYMEKEIIKNLIILIFINTILSSLLILCYGFIGAAIGGSISYLLLCLPKNFSNKNEIKLTESKKSIIMFKDFNFLIICVKKILKNIKK